MGAELHAVLLNISRSSDRNLFNLNLSFYQRVETSCMRSHCDVAEQWAISSTTYCTVFLTVAVKSEGEVLVQGCEKSKTLPTKRVSMD